MAGLRELAEADLSGILEDSVNGFGFAITVTNPAGDSEALTGFSTDIAQVIDPDTGQTVSGRFASVTLRLSTIVPLLGMPVAVSDATAKPWVVEFDDINGVAGKFKVAGTAPDRTLGIIVLRLEVYK